MSEVTWSLRDDIPPHFAAAEWTRVKPTGRLRRKGGVLQQEYAQYWWNELGGSHVTEWRDVPEVEEISEKED